MSFGENCDVVIEMKGDPIYQKQKVPWWISLRTDRYKYIRNLLPGETEELYDMKNDPDEIWNLAIGKDHLTLLRKLRKKTIRELQKTDCAFAQKMPHVQCP
jgi:arylsulfatase A-like enzyme